MVRYLPCPLSQKLEAAQAMRIINLLKAALSGLPLARTSQRQVRDGQTHCLTPLLRPFSGKSELPWKCRLKYLSNTLRPHIARQGRHCLKHGNSSRNADNGLQTTFASLYMNAGWMRPLLWGE